MTTTTKSIYRGGPFPIRFQLSGALIKFLLYFIDMRYKIRALTIECIHNHQRHQDMYRVALEFLPWLAFARLVDRDMLSCT